MNANRARRSVSDALAQFVMGVGHVVMYVNGVLVVVIMLQVVLRYVFGRGLVALEELEWHLWAVGFLFGLSYCVAEDSNIRMDLLYQFLPKRAREWLDALGLLILVVPFVIVMFLHGMDFTEHSWRLSERSEAPLGLSYRWAIKSAIPISMIALGLAVLARLVRFFEFLRRHDGTQ